MNKVKTQRLMNKFGANVLDRQVGLIEKRSDKLIGILQQYRYIKPTFTLSTDKTQINAKIERLMYLNKTYARQDVLVRKAVVDFFDYSNELLKHAENETHEKQIHIIEKISQNSDKFKDITNHATGWCNEIIPYINKLHESVKKLADLERSLENIPTN